jgi:hypothetical protein
LLDIANQSSSKPLSAVKQFISDLCERKLQESLPLLEESELHDCISNLDIKIISRIDSSPMDEEIQSQEKERKREMISRVKFAQTFVYLIYYLSQKDLTMVEKLFNRLKQLLQESETEQSGNTVPFSQRIDCPVAFKRIENELLRSFFELFCGLLKNEAGSEEATGDLMTICNSLQQALKDPEEYFTLDNDSDFYPTQSKALAAFARIVKPWTPLFFQLAQEMVAESKHKGSAEYKALEGKIIEFMTSWDQFTGEQEIELSNQFTISFL